MTETKGKAKIRIGIAGYGNLGKGAENAIKMNDDMVLSAIFSRRAPSSIGPIDKAVPVYSIQDAAAHADEIDVLLLCSGSATDLPVQSPLLAQSFHLVESFDTHAHIPEHFSRVDAAAASSGHVALICCGWDPGLFSLSRLYSSAVLPYGQNYTFWGPGVSQGHSDALRRIPCVRDARQYTIPCSDALDAVRSGSAPELSKRQMHRRDCYIVPEEGADLASIEQAAKTMPNYFADYDTDVTFITEEELQEKHSALPHGGFVLRSGKTNPESDGNCVIEYSLKLDSNPDFTGSVLVAYARAVYRLSQEGVSGCKTVFDIAPALLSPLSGDQLRAQLL